jgi:hypothetical protein
VGNHSGNKLDYKQEPLDGIMDRAKAECRFSDRLYEILLAYQQGKSLIGHPPATPPGNVGELNPAMSRIYNLIWTAVIDLNGKAGSKKKDKQQMEVIA